MTSAINPNNIDTTYPVAGQDNSTQGFRTNFTNIKNNFQAAKDEISALQANAVIVGSSVVNNLDGATIYDAVLQNVGYSQLSQGNAAPNIVVNYASASYQSVTANANATINFSNFPTNKGAEVFLSINARAANTTAVPYTVAIANLSPASSGIIGLVGNTITFPGTNSTDAGTHVYQVTTTDQGSTLTLSPFATLSQPLNATSEDVANTAVINLSKSDSYFSTSAAEVSTLPAGVNGQVKVLAMYADGGDMVITVTNAGWKTSGTGTITFDTIGDSCVLKYINSKWFCIGNNGCTFA